jgi:hypothetical protein
VNLTAGKPDRKVQPALPNVYFANTYANGTRTILWQTYYSIACPLLVRSCRVQIDSNSIVMVPRRIHVIQQSEVFQTGCTDLLQELPLETRL